MFPTFSSLSTPTAWGEAGRNALKIIAVMNGSMGEAGLYAHRQPESGEPRSDVLTGIITARGDIRIAVAHPSSRARLGYLVSTWVQGEHFWAAHLDDDDSTHVGTDRDPATACGLITGVTA